MKITEGSFAEVRNHPAVIEAYLGHRRRCRLSMALLQLDNVMAYYGPVRALNDVSISIEAGEIVCLLGGNASGKSTTMKTILGMVRAGSGSVQFGGERIDRLPTQASSRAASRWCPRRAGCSAA